jgi:hypothetical protein
MNYGDYVVYRSQYRGVVRDQMAEPKMMSETLS